MLPTRLTRALVIAAHLLVLAAFGASPLAALPVRELPPPALEKAYLAARASAPATPYHRLLHRWYDPEIGRFISRDPISFAGGDLNLYRYVGNNPINARDPSGLFTGAEVVVGLALALITHHFIDPEGRAEQDLQVFSAMTAPIRAADDALESAGLAPGDRQLVMALTVRMSPQAVALARSRGIRIPRLRLPSLRSCPALGSGELEDLLYGGRPGLNLPGRAGVPIPRRPTVAELQNLQSKHGVEFAVTYKHGPRKNGGGGQYYLHSGTPHRVDTPLEPDRMLIYHTHPEGYPNPSTDDRRVMKFLEYVVGSPQRTSYMVPVDNDPVPFTKDQ